MSAMVELAERVEKRNDPMIVEGDLYRRIVSERRERMLCRAMAAEDGFDPDEETDPVVGRPRWKDYAHYLRIVDSGVDRITAEEIANELRARASAEQ